MSAGPAPIGTVLDELVQALDRASAYNPQDQVAPAAVLWTDKDRQWEAVIPRLLHTSPARSGIHVAYGAPRRHTHAIGAGRCEARGWRSAYFSQPILEGDRSLCSPAPSPLVPRQRGQSANSLGNWRARQDSNLRPSAEKADALSI